MEKQLKVGNDFYWKRKMEHEAPSKLSRRQVPMESAWGLKPQVRKFLKFCAEDVQFCAAFDFGLLLQSLFILHAHQKAESPVKKVESDLLAHRFDAGTLNSREWK